MDTAVVTVIQSMASTTISFAGDVVTNLWPVLLSLAVLFAVGSFIARKAKGVGR